MEVSYSRVTQVVDAVNVAQARCLICGHVVCYLGWGLTEIKCHRCKAVLNVSRSEEDMRLGKPPFVELHKDG